jgi:fibronectin type 3 domain-containing protein
LVLNTLYRKEKTNSKATTRNKMKKKIVLILTPLVLLSVIALSQTPIASWKLNNDTNDASGNGINGTPISSPTYTTSSIEGSHALSLNGTNQYIDLGNPSSLPSGTQARTLSAWAKTNTITGFHWIVAFGTATGSNAMMLGQNGAQLRGGSYANDLAAADKWTTGVWHHICLTYDGTYARLYFNGVQVSYAIKSWNLLQLRAYIGRNVNNSEYWNGEIDDVRIYNTALTAAQVQAIATPLPAAPTSLSAPSSSLNSINLTWNDASTNETGFRIERSLSSGTGYSLVTTTAANATSFTDTGLSSGTKYYYRVNAINAGGQSDYSNEVNATTLSIPTVPNNLIATSTSATSINLTWTDASTNETGFQVERSTTSGTGFTLISTTSANAASFIDNGRQPSTTYYYRVRAVNASGNSAYTSEVSATTLVTIPSTPAGLSAVASSSSTISIQWSDNSSNEVEFEIERSERSGSGFVLIGTSPANATTFSDSSLISGMTYYYRVRATNGGGSSAYTSEANATTLPIEGGTQLCENIYCDGNGGVGIGTPTVPTGYRMAVKGKVMAEGVKVALETEWPDYVFEEGYKLMDIDALKKFIEANGHLPNVPAAHKVANEGVDVAEINVVLLEKIEELSLYLINMEERMKLLEEENSRLKSKKKSRK